MPKSFTQDILAHQNPSATVGPFDGLAAAYMRLNGAHVLITSPNQHHIPLPVLGEEDVRLRANLRYGTADHTLWPQFVTPETSHFAVIPQRPADTNDILAPIWWDPSPADFVPSYGGILSGLGTVHRHRLDSLQRVEGEMRSRVKSYLESIPTPSNLAVEQVNLRLYHMENSFIRLSGLRVSFAETVFTITEFQRNCLEIIGFINFMQIYRPRLAGMQLASRSADNVMGCFTWDPRATQELFKAGVPVWFLRRWEGPEYPFNNNILQVVDFTMPDPSILKEHAIITFPTLFRGLMTNEKRYRTIWDSSLARLTSADPFRNESAPQSTASSMSLQTASRPYPAPGNRPTRSNAEPQRLSRNKYLPLQHPAAPYSIEAWRDALASVDQSPVNIVDPLALCTTAGHYVVPDPGVILGPESDEKKARYLTTWLHCRNSWFLVVANDGLALSNQSWRDVLGLNLSQGLAGENPVPRFQQTMPTPSSPSTSTLPARPLPPSLPARPSRSTQSKSRSSRQNKPEERREQTFELLKHKSVFADTVHTSDVAPHIVWNGMKYPADALPSESIIREVLWELYEINFVHELEALDRRACMLMDGDKATGQFQRQRLIIDCYDNIYQYKSPSIPSHNLGLAADEIMDRFPFVLTLARIMKSWKGNPPASFARYCDSLRPEMLGRTFAAQMERDVAMFYCQTFFNYFGRAAQVPHRLYRVD